MICKHYVDVSGLYIHTDFDMLKDDEVLKAFLEQAEEVKGVESISVGRYHLDISFGFLFAVDVCAKSILSLFSDVYKVDTTNPFDITDVMAKMDSMPEMADSTALKLNAMFGGEDVEA